jgi:hypothetical protein
MVFGGRRNGLVVQIRHNGQKPFAPEERIVGNPPVSLVLPAHWKATDLCSKRAPSGFSLRAEAATSGDTLGASPALGALAAGLEEGENRETDAFSFLLSAPDRYGYD